MNALIARRNARRRSHGGRSGARECDRNLRAFAEQDPKGAGMIPYLVLLANDVDPVAVERARCGRPQRLTSAERLEAVRQLTWAGYGAPETAQTLHLSQRTVERHLARLAHDPVPFSLTGAARAWLRTHSVDL